MAISYCFHFLLFLSAVLRLFLVDCLDQKVNEAYGFKETRGNLGPQSHHVISLSSLMPAGVCSSPAQGSEVLSRVLLITHKHGPCSPLKEGNEKIPSLHRILIDHRTRVKSIHSKISNQDPTTDSAAKIPIKLGTGNFVIRIGLGTPKQDFTVEFDTGSDLTWIQCYSQQDPFFNSSASSTYSNISCNSATCAQLQSATGYTKNCSTTCMYKITYGDGSYSEGYFATDTLTLSSFDVFPKFKFGCSEKKHDLFGSVDGLLGLGPSHVSMVSQPSQNFGKLFSYCLPSTSSSTGFLAFGSQVGDSSTAQYTPLLTDSKNSSFYFLNMTDISVGGKSLSIPESVFTTSGTIIDSGTVITMLPPTAYSALRSAFRLAMSQYPVYSSEYSTLILDTCYNLNGYDRVTVPNIVLHFAGGANLSIDYSGIIIQTDITHYCLAFAGNNADTDVAILGNMQQRGIEVIYNVTGGKLGFGTRACRATTFSAPPPLIEPYPSPTPVGNQAQAFCTSINIILPQRLIE